MVSRISSMKRATKMNRISVSDEFLVPDYDGETIANIPATVASLLEAEFAGLPALKKPYWEPLRGDVRRVVLILLDSFGWSLFEEHRSNLEWLEHQADITAKITSVFPSTTVSALSSLWTGYAPGQHGLVGLRIFFPDLAVLGQLIKFSPTFGSYPDALVTAGTDPSDFLMVPGLGEQFRDAGIPCHVFKGRSIVRSALSQMHDRGVEHEYGIVTSSDLFVQLRDVLERTAGSKLYAYGYWPAIDTLSHIHGPQHPSVSAELMTFFDQLRIELLESLSGAAREGTVILVTGDHGQILAPPEQNIVVEEDPFLAKLLLMRPAGEPRTPFLYAKQGKRKDLLTYLNEGLGHALQAWDSEEAVSQGLFGPEPISGDTTARLGDVVAAMRQGYLLLTAPEVRRIADFKGRHGGMTPPEMEVPWICLRLDG